MVDFKTWNVKKLGDLIITMIVLLFFVTIVHMVISPLLVTILPTVFTAKLTITDTILFLILVHATTK